MKSNEFAPRKSLRNGCYCLLVLSFWLLSVFFGFRTYGVCGDTRQNENTLGRAGLVGSGGVTPSRSSILGGTKAVWPLYSKW